MFKNHPVCVDAGMTKEGGVHTAGLGERRAWLRGSECPNTAQPGHVGAVFLLLPFNACTWALR